MWIHARESELVKKVKMVKSQNVDFWLEKLEFNLTRWSNDHFAPWLKLVEKSNILLDNSTNS